MRPLRIVLVTRRYWPLVGGAETIMASLAVEFRRLGAMTTILTAQWDKTWPTSCVLDDVPIIRLPQPTRRGWGTLRYMNHLHRWLRKYQTDFDVVYVSMLKHDAYTAIGALASTTIPIVLRAEGGGPTGDCQWQRESHFGNRIRARCLQANGLVAISPAIYEELIREGYPGAHIHRIDNGVAPSTPINQNTRQAARQSLAEANTELQFPPGAKLAVYSGRLHPGKGLKHLIEAWPRVLKDWPTARLWLVGEGEERATLRELIHAHGLTNHIALPGIFDSLDDVLAAADLYILPSFEEGMSIGLLEAMARGLPTVATDIPGNRAMAQHGVTSQLVPPGDTIALAAAIRQVWSDDQTANRMSSAARERLVRQFSLKSVAQRHLELFEHLVADNNQPRIEPNKTT